MYTNTYDVRDRNTKQDFETLMEGLVEVGAEKGYLGNLREVLRRNPDIREKVKDYVIIKADFDVTVTPTNLGDPVKDIFRAVVNTTNDSGLGNGVLSIRTHLLLEVGAGDISHGAGKCADVHVLAQKAREKMRRRLDSVTGAYNVSVKTENMSTACINEGCAGYL